MNIPLTSFSNLHPADCRVPDVLDLAATHRRPEVVDKLLSGDRLLRPLYFRAVQFYRVFNPVLHDHLSMQGSIFGQTFTRWAARMGTQSR